MVPFFVQIKCQLGQSYDVANKLADAELASEIYSTAGHYDLLVNQSPAALNLTEHDLYMTHSLTVMFMATLDLGNAIEITQVNTYSWHANSRGPQVYNLFASEGAGPGFNPTPDSHTDPATCGWKLIATVDTVPTQGETGGQYGVSITDASGSLGKFRYLLFDSIPTEFDNPWGNTFFSEINVIARQ